MLMLKEGQENQHLTLQIIFSLKFGVAQGSSLWTIIFFSPCLQAF